MLRPPVRQCKPTGVELAPGTRVLVMADGGGVAAALTERLAAIGCAALVVDDAPDSGALTARLDEWCAAGPIDGIYWLPALDPEGAVADLDLAGWKEATRRRVKLLHASLHHLLGHDGEPVPFLVAATRLGGRHGYDDAGATNPMGGAVTGFAKAYKREQPAALVKVVDHGIGDAPGAVADHLLAETQRDPGAVEVGYADGSRWTVALREEPAADGNSGLPLGPDTVFAVTGAAGGIVSAIVDDLAHASRGTFHLLDLAAPPDPLDADVAAFVADREALKPVLAERMRAAGQRPTPVMVERELARLERSAAALAAIRAVETAGGRAHYHRVDLTDPGAVAAVIDRIRETSGRVDVLVHAAGLEVSRMLADKRPAEFDLVFDVKSDGWFNLLHAIGDMPLSATVAFSSVAGRFGNGGQTDYSAANDLLCKFTSSFRTTRPATRGIAIDWTAWGGIGMATRGSIPKMMELAGIDMLAPEAGVPTVRRELTAGARRGEVVVAGRLGILAHELDDTGGLDAGSVDTTAAGTMVGRAAAMPLQRGLVVETVLDPSRQAFLHDHQIDGTPVLPGVMGIEAFTETARLVAPHLDVVAVEDVEFLAPFKFYRGAPRTVTVEAQGEADGDGLAVRCRLTGTRSLPNRPEPQVTVHFTATVRMARSRPVPPRAAVPHLDVDAPSAEADAIYHLYFHGPAYRVLERAWRDDGHPVGLLAGALPPDHEPAEAELLSEPRLIELCFQTAGLWEMGTSGRMALPRHIDRVTTYAHPAGNQTLLAIITRTGDGFDGRVVDESGTVLVELAGYRTVELPGTVDATDAAPVRAAME